MQLLNGLSFETLGEHLDKSLSQFGHVILISDAAHGQFVTTIQYFLVDIPF